MIARWAPPAENHTEVYIRYVAEAAGVEPSQPIDTRNKATMTRITAAISRVENGTEADASQIEQGWRLFIG